VGVTSATPGATVIRLDAHDVGVATTTPDAFGSNNVDYSPAMILCPFPYDPMAVVTLTEEDKDD
jgi:hypothetical protein